MLRLIPPLKIIVCRYSQQPTPPLAPLPLPVSSTEMTVPADLFTMEPAEAIVLVSCPHS